MRRVVVLACSVAVCATTAGPARATRPLLPNLVPLPTRELYVGTPTSVHDRGDHRIVHGCDPEDAAQRGAWRCLRYDTAVANFGTGAFEIRTRVDEIAGARSVMQRVYRSDGTYADRMAGTFEFDPAHAHFHYSAFAVAALWRSDAHGRRLGRAPLRTGDKDGFCLEDVQRRGGDVEAAYLWPYACYPRLSADGSVAQVQGISVGWSDIYDITVPHQYVEISGVPDGYYLLAITVDPLHRVQQATARDDTVWQRLRLTGNTAALV